MPDARTQMIPTDPSILLMGMDLEGALRFHAEAIRWAPSGTVTPGLDYTELWESGRQGRTSVVLKVCDLLDLAAGHDAVPSDLRGDIAASNASMRAAMQDRHVPDTFHLLNWNDKPHRLLYDAYDLIERAADAVAGLPARTA